MLQPDASSPVEAIPTDNPAQAPEVGIALCLSGGGFRAMLFHVGALWRLNDAGYLPRLARISSVSGGSITAGVLGLAWPRLDFDDRGKARQFEREVTAPLRHLASRTIDIWAVLRGVLGPGTVSDQVAKAYRDHLFGDHTLQDLPDDGAGPRFVINASNLQSGALWRFSKPYMWDYRVGEVVQPAVPLAVAVAASSAFPPFLSPMILHLDGAAFTPGSGMDLQRPPYTTRVVLADGGVYDNLGLETAWKVLATILVSDGGGKMQPTGRPAADWLRQSQRVLEVIDNQVRSLRKRQTIASYQLPPGQPGYRTGAYWGIRTNIADYGLADTLPCPDAATQRLAGVPTRLARLDGTTQERLINWGFAVCDAALRRHVEPELPAPANFPYPRVGVG